VSYHGCRDSRPGAGLLSVSPAPAQTTWFPGKICVAREVGKMHDGSDSLEMINGVPVVAAPEEIDVTTAEQLRSVLLEAASHGHTTIVVDMTRTRFCDSCGLSVLVRAHKRACGEGGELRLVIPPGGTVFRIFTLTSLYRLIPRFDSLTEALLQRPAALVQPLRPRPSPGLGGAAYPPGNLDGGVRADG